MTGRALARAGVVVGAFYLASRLLGWLRLAVIPNLYGVGPELDAYFAAFRIPDLIYQLVAAGAVGSALIPVLAGLHHAGEHHRAQRVIATVFTSMLLVLSAAALVMFVLADVLVPVLVPGFDAETTATTVRLTRIMLLSPVLLALGAVASSILNLEGRFAAAALAPILYNVAIIAAAVLLGPLLGIDALAVGVVIGAALHISIQVPQLRRFWRLQLLVDLADEAATRILRLLAPRALGLGANQVTFIVHTTLATTLAVGAVTIYTIAFTIFVIPVGVIGLPVGVLLLPAMSRAFAAGETRTFGSLVVGGLRLLLFVMLVLSALGIVLSRQVVELLFGYGAFDGAALDQMATALSILLVGLAGNALCLLLARVFYSIQDTATPLLGVLVYVVVSVGIALLTIDRLGLLGLAVGVAAGDWVEAVFLTLLLRRRLRDLDLLGVLRAVPVIGLGAVLAGAVALGVVLGADALLGSDPGTLGVLVQAALAAAAGGAAYLVYTRLVRLPELPRAIELARSAIRRPGPAA